MPSAFSYNHLQFPRQNDYKVAASTVLQSTVTDRDFAISPRKGAVWIGVTLRFAVCPHFRVSTMHFACCPCSLAQQDLLLWEALSAPPTFPWEKVTPEGLFTPLLPSCQRNKRTSQGILLSHESHASAHRYMT